jgi:hypothetical protein
MQLAFEPYEPTNVIAYDPASDFTIASWLDDHLSGSVAANHVIVGGRLPGQAGQWLSVCGKPLGIYGQLGKTGVGPFDESYFLTFAALADVASFCRSAPAASADHIDGKVCPPDPCSPIGYPPFCCSSRSPVWETSNLR